MYWTKSHDAEVMVRNSWLFLFRGVFGTFEFGHVVVYIKCTRNSKPESRPELQVTANK